MSEYKELKEKVWLCNMELYNKGLVVQTFGNASGIDRNKSVIAIKPSGISYRDFQSEDVVIVDLENKVVEGVLNPSSDTKTHLVLYKNCPQIGSIIHTHSTFATAWAQAKKPIPCYGTTHADYAQCEIPCTDDLSDEQISGDYELETGNQIIKKLSEGYLKKTQMILVAGHAPFTWGKDTSEALQNTILLEEIAKLAFLTTILNPDALSLSDILLDKHYLRKHGSKAYYGQKRN